MAFESFSQANFSLLWGIFTITVVLGAVIAKTNFCTMGAVSDALNMDDWGRMRAWILAIAIALAGLALLEKLHLAAPNEAFPPYRSGQLAWIENILGGFAFGIGMTLAGGCANKCIVRTGGGNLKSLLVFLVLSPVAYFMVRPFPGTDQTLYSLLFYPWTSLLTIDVGKSQDLGTLVAGPENGPFLRTAIAVALAIALAWFAFSSSSFRRNRDNWLSGITVGLAVVAVWFLTSNGTIDVDGETVSPLTYAEDWDFYAESGAGKPADIASLAPQSLSFVNPIGQTYGYVANAFDRSFVTYGIMAVFGLAAGSFFWSLANRRFRFEWFSDRSDLFRHISGAVLMGLGGILGMGCTIGQGVTGLSTLAAGSFLTIFSIVFGCMLTLRVQLYRIIYENEASFAAAIVSALVDMHLLPSRMRILDAVR